MIKINGQTVTLDDNVTVSKYLKSANYNISRIVVEINGIIVPKSQYDSTSIKDNDIVEIVSFVGGG